MSKLLQKDGKVTGIETSDGDQLMADVVIATELRAAGASDDAPFFMFPFIDVRGFPSGRYLDTAMVQSQVEVRWNPFGRIGVVAFSGTGLVAEDFGSLRLSDGAIGYGAGVRYRISDADRMNVGLDVAFGDDDVAVYFRIGEAF